MPEPKFTIREYKPEDRNAVRSIAFETGFMGESIDWQWSDQKSFADLITNYYLNQEPESAFVAEKDGIVIGYLLGCIDSKKAKGSAAKEIGKIILHGGLIRPSIAPFLWRSVFDIIRDREVADDELIDPRWPAHMHLNLLPEGRGKRLVYGLMNMWFDKLRNANVPGVHFAAFTENERVIQLAQLYGFEQYGLPISIPGFRTLDNKRMFAQWMVRSTAPPLKLKLPSMR
jgi:hypothetical protein